MMTHAQAKQQVCREWRELRAHGKIKDGHVDRSTFWIEREDRIKFRTKPGVDPWQYVQTWLNACDPG